MNMIVTNSCLFMRVTSQCLNLSLKHTRGRNQYFTIGMFAQLCVGVQARGLSHEYLCLSVPLSL